MQVGILAGGFGTRLSEETTHIPKPMVEIGEKPSEYSKEVHAVITKYFGKGDK